MKAKFSLGAFGIILNENKQVLLCHRRDLDLWNFPGGMVELGELPTEAVLREIKEETGLDAEIIELVGVYRKTRQPDDLVFTFVCKVIGGALTLNPEAKALEYFDAQNLPANTIPAQAERIKDALSGIDKPIFRKQTTIPAREMLKAFRKEGQ